VVDVVKATSGTVQAPTLAVAARTAAQITLKDPALVLVGNSTDASLPLSASASSGAVVDVSVETANLRFVVKNPTAGNTVLTIRQAPDRGTRVETLEVSQVDANAAVASKTYRTLVRPDVVSSVNVSVAAAASSLTVSGIGPSAPNNVTSLPGASSTLLTWAAPASTSTAITGYRVYASPSQDDTWVQIAAVDSATTQYVAPYPAASNTQREMSFVVVSVDAQDRFSQVLEYAGNRVVDHIEASFGVARGTPGALVTSSTLPLPNNVLITGSVTGGEASINGGAWQVANLVIPPFATVQLRGVASATASQWTMVTLNGPTSASSFSILAAPPPFCRRPTRPVVESGAFIRYLDGIVGTPLMQGLYPAAEVSPTAANALSTHYSDNLDAYDFNGDGFSTVDVDGLLYARYALGFRDSAMVSGIKVGTARSTTQIQAALAACQ
jgi:hypothetical protein